jgi:hypothetical protein
MPKAIEVFNVQENAKDLFHCLAFILRILHRSVCFGGCGHVHSKYYKRLYFVKLRELATTIITVNKSRMSRDFFYPPECAIPI